MPILPTRKFRGKVIGAGERAVVKEDRGIVARFIRRRPFRVGQSEADFERQIETPKFHFYKNKIARAISPNNFIHITGAFSRARPFMQVVLSKKKEFDIHSQEIIQTIARKNLMHPKNQTTLYGFLGSDLFKAHAERVRKEADPIAQRFAKLGIELSVNPLNVYFDARGNPIFLEIGSINPYTLQRKLPDNQKIKNYIERATVEWERISRTYDES